MSHSSIAVHASESQESTTKLGFWIYLMTDCVLFGSLFATYIVLRDNTYGGVSGKDIFDMPFVLAETLILLTSSFICGLTMLAVRQNSRRWVLAGLSGVALLGVSFLSLELIEFSKLATEGHGWQASAFLSAFFTLVGTHGAHIAIGLLWLIVIGWQVVRRGLTGGVVRRLGLFGMFWHFLDIIWIFIFTIVYLMGAL
jgi:cytochrome o ubiquinol oxidase subunit 3